MNVGMAKVKDPGIILDNATVDTPLPDVESFRVSYKEKIFRCRKCDSRGNIYFYLERSHRQKKNHSICLQAGRIKRCIDKESR